MPPPFFYKTLNTESKDRMAETQETLQVVKDLREFVNNWGHIELASIDKVPLFLEWLDYQIDTNCEGFITDYLIKQVKRKFPYAAENAQWCQLSFMVPNDGVTAGRHTQKLHELLYELLGHEKFVGMCSEIPINLDGEQV